MKILKLTLKKAPFDVMKTGEKKNEYRRPSKWIESRLYDKDGNPREYDAIEFINGYGATRPRFMCKYLGIGMSMQNYSLSYSNGLKVRVSDGDYIIKCGEILNESKIISVKK